MVNLARVGRDDDAQGGEKGPESKHESWGAAPAGP